MKFHILFGSVVSYFLMIISYLVDKMEDLMNTNEHETIMK